MQNQWNLSDFINSKNEYKNSTSSFKHVVHEIIWIILCHRWPWSVSSFKQRSRSLQNLKIHHYLVHIVQNFALYYYKWLLNIFQHVNTYRSHLFNAINKESWIYIYHIASFDIKWDQEQFFSSGNLQPPPKVKFIILQINVPCMGCF